MAEARGRSPGRAGGLLVFGLAGAAALSESCGPSWILGCPLRALLGERPSISRCVTCPIRGRRPRARPGTARGFPPTPQVLKNTAEEIAKTKLGVHWASRFCQQYRERLTSVYLRTIDHRRKVAYNSHYFCQFFDVISCLTAIPWHCPACF